MFRKKLLPVEVAGLMVIGVLFGLSACNAAKTTTPPPTISGPGGGSIVNSDGEVTAKIQALRQESNGFPWEVDILVENSVDVGTLPNPTKDSVGKVITVKTDENMASYKAGDAITAKVKYVGDVPKPGITLYLYEVVLQNPPGY